VTIAVVLAFLPKRVVDSLGWSGEVIFIAAVVVFVAGLPAFYRRAKDEAAPTKKSDWIGYGVIAAFCLGVGIVAWRVLRE
jgi:hypothetical protein